MNPAEAVVFELDCGAVVTVRVVVDGAQCRRRDGECMTAEEIASAIWTAMQLDDLASMPAPRGSFETEGD